ncbi:hypothetical protein [Actinacidiphila acididurans]|uniref:Pullulanase n=1 Tax=Actinacidiphila acididurans TaxID=2784346 RepID=A0ABS2TLD1_9ACTN|nr:hypothetical protein [Actinacidiphila acididurans]MBM9503045.1 hypothetical protein [Actinacidiphila acididurans]
MIMDVVYNHTYSKDAFGNITSKCYTQNDLSGTGNSLDDGNPMVARMIQDSLEHWVRDYNVDGFRFDLLGVHYAANAAAPTAYDTVVVYNPTSSTYYATLPTGTWTKVLDTPGAVNVQHHLRRPVRHGIRSASAPSPC